MPAGLVSNVGSCAGDGSKFALAFDSASTSGANCMLRRCCESCAVFEAVKSPQSKAGFPGLGHFRVVG